MNSMLTAIIDRKKETLEDSKKRDPIGQVRARAQARTDFRSFRQAVSRPGVVNVIAEIKKASPSAGILREDFDPVALARTYADTGACAISVLTEEHYFHGSLAHLASIRQDVSVPLLRKDFIVDAYQIYESVAGGADAVLLIAAVLEADVLSGLMKTAAELRLDCLVEVHDEQDMARAVAAGADIIGINNRNLNTFVVDLETTARLLPLIPPGAAAVMESGIKTKADIERFRAKGVSAFLIGETLVRSADPGKTLKTLNG